MNLESYLRDMARSSYWQEIYRTSKECNGIYLFENQINISGVQSLFLYWLRVYNLLYNEMCNGDWENLDQDVIDDNDRTTAFLYWRKLEISKEKNEAKKPPRGSNKKGHKEFKIYKGNK